MEKYQGKITSINKREHRFNVMAFVEGEQVGNSE